MKVLIIGAGPTGLTAALQFVNKGIIPSIVEKRPNSSTLSRAVGIMPASLEKLGKNIASRIQEESMPFMRINMHINKSKVLNLNFNGKVSESEVLSGLPQDRTEEIIKEELEKLGVGINYGTEVVDIKTDDNHAEVWFKNEEESRKYDWVIACDGINSVTRQKLGIEYQGFDLEEQWSIADVELEEDVFEYDANNVWMKIGKEYAAVVSLPIGKNRIRLISTSVDCLNTIPVDLKIKKINRQGNFTVSVRQVTDYKKGRVLLAGDSAHCHSPVGGKGMNLGIDDAYAAVRSILDGTTEEYSENRHKRGKKVIDESESLRKMIMSKSPVLKYVMKTIFSIVNMIPFLHNRAIKRVSRL